MFLQYPRRGIIVYPTFYLLNGLLQATFAVNHGWRFVEKNGHQWTSILEILKLEFLEVEAFPSGLSEHEPPSFILVKDHYLFQNGFHVSSQITQIEFSAGIEAKHWSLPALKFWGSWDFLTGLGGKDGLCHLRRCPGMGEEFLTLEQAVAVTVCKAGGWAAAPRRSPEAILEHQDLLHVQWNLVFPFQWLIVGKWVAQD